MKHSSRRPTPAAIALTVLCTLFCNQLTYGKEIQDFNFNWRFHLGEVESAHFTDHNDSLWSRLRLPHDWSVSLPYTTEGTASSTGFKAGGVGWYRKTFELSGEDQDKAIWLEFDGIYNNSQIWVNGHFAAERPYGYSSFTAPVDPYMREGKNVVAVRVDRTAYADSRWYTGSGIYRPVRLVKAHPIHIAHWGVQISTESIATDSAIISIKTQIKNASSHSERLYLDISIIDKDGTFVREHKVKIPGNTKDTPHSKVSIPSPKLWSPNTPNLYSARLTLRSKNKIYDRETVSFGIRSIEFDAKKGFLLNGKQTKIKGVNLHHDAGALGAAVPKEVWRYRLGKLASIGVNAIRLAHNPHSSELLDLCDKMGFLTIAEAFDDWERPKEKSLVFLSDNSASGQAAASYSKHFNQWAERDIKDMVRRDFNHPSVILWSIGNEIEWTYPYYNEALLFEDEGGEYRKNPAVYEPARARKSFDSKRGSQPDNLARIARQLAGYVKSVDQSRPVTAGLVLPSVGFVSGYTDALDVVGFNYRALEYDIAHKTYPDKPIYGSENWGTWPEWQAVRDREFIPGIFVWTGFAYKGEAGPWPRKGLEISLFDFNGNKTPRGHQFESFWVDKPKVYLATLPAEKSEYQYSSTKGWTFTERQYSEPKMQWLRPWEWYQVEEKWRYKNNQKIIVHVYSNTEQSELFLNGRSLGRQNISDKNNRILLWQVPYQAGDLKVVGYNKGKPQASYQLNTHTDVSAIMLKSTKQLIKADHYDVAHIQARLVDENGNTVVTPKHRLHFDIEGPATILAVDNGWENNVEPEQASTIQTHNGKALAILQATDKSGSIKISARLKDGPSASLIIESRP